MGRLASSTITLIAVAVGVFVLVWTIKGPVAANDLLDDVVNGFADLVRAISGWVLDWVNRLTS